MKIILWVKYLSGTPRSRARSEGGYSTPFLDGCGSFSNNSVTGLNDFLLGDDDIASIHSTSTSKTSPMTRLIKEMQAMSHCPEDDKSTCLPCCLIM